MSSEVEEMVEDAELSENDHVMCGRIKQLTVVAIDEGRRGRIHELVRATGISEQENAAGRE